MKKRIISLALALMMCLSLLPGMALAADPSTFLKDCLNNGKLSTAATPYVVVDDGSGHSFFTMYYYQTPELQELALDIQRRGDEFWETYDLHWLDPFIQIDVKFDDGQWLSELDDWDALNDWGEVEYGEGRGSGYAFSLQEGKSEDNANKLLSVTQTDLYYIESDNSDLDFLRPYINTTQDAYGYDVNRFDLENHTISFRIRWGVNSMQHYYSGDPKQVFTFGGWSPATSIGKNGTQEALVAPTKLDAPKLSQFSLVTDDDGDAYATYFVEFPDSVYAAERYHYIADNAFEPLYIQAQMKVNGGEWKDTYTANPTWMTNGFRSTGSDAIKEGDKVQIRVRIETSYPEGNSEWSNIVGNVAEHQASSWAQAELAEADALGLIPEVLQGEDLTKPITRAEFAAVAVKVYENLSGTAAIPAVNNPFTDTQDVEVLKAYNIGAVNGTSATTFTPAALLTREQAATMLTRVFKKVSLVGWTLATDNQFSLNYAKPAAFADDKDISDYAKDSVYFMAANGIINGVGNNNFAPRAVTSAQQAEGYAQATREQALLIAVRMVKNLSAA